MQERTPKAEVDVGIGWRADLDAAEHDSRFIKGIAAQSKALLLLPAYCNAEVMLRFLSQKTTSVLFASRVSIRGDTPEVLAIAQNDQAQRRQACRPFGTRSVRTGATC